MALAEQACEVPFVRAIPLLNACKLWAELAEIIKGIEEPPAEHQIAKSELEKCDQDMHKIIRDYQSQHTRLEVEQLTSDWRGAKSLEDEEAALSSIRQLLPLSPTRIPIPEEFLDAFWRRHEMSVANKMIEIRVQRLLERATVTSLGFEERSLALHEAQGLVRSSDNDLFERINNARMQLRSDATGRLEEDNRQFEQRMAEKSYDHAVSILNHMATVLRHCDDDETRWSQRLKELSNRLNEARQPSGPEIALQRLVEMMERAIHSEPQQMYDALESIEKVLREIPMDLSPVLGGLKDKVTKHAGKLVESLPEPEGITQHTIRRYIDDICNGKIGLQTMART